MNLKPTSGLNVIVYSTGTLSLNPHELAAVTTKIVDRGGFTGTELTHVSRSDAILIVQRIADSGIDLRVVVLPDTAFESFSTLI